MEHDGETILDAVKRTSEAYYRSDRTDCGEEAAAYIAALEARIAMLVRSDSATTAALLAYR